MNKYLHITLITLSLLLLSQTLFSYYHAAITFTPDFSIFYQSAGDMLHNTNVYTDKTLYTIFNYPITTAYLFAPFTLVSYIIAQEIFAGINVIAAIVCVLVCLQILQWHVSFSNKLFITALFLFSFPTKFTIGMGQVNLVAYAWLLASFYCYQRKKIMISVISFTLAVVFKPVLFFLVFFYILRKQWTYLFTFFITTICIFIGLPLLSGKEKLLYTYVQSLFSQMNTMQGREVYYNQGISGFVSRIITNEEIRKYATEILSIGTLGLLFIKNQKNDIYLFSVTLTVLVLIDPLSWQHHFVFLLLPFLYCVQKVSQQYKIVNMLLIAIMYFLITGNISKPISEYTLLFGIIESHVFFGTVGLFALLLFLDRTEAGLLKKVSVKK